MISTGIKKRLKRIDVVVTLLIEVTLLDLDVLLYCTVVYFSVAVIEEISLG